MRIKIIISLICFILFSFAFVYGELKDNESSNPIFVFSEDYSPPKTLLIFDYAKEDTPIITIHYDGKVELSKDLKLDEASKLFWDSISKAFTTLLTDRDKEIKILEDKIKELEDNEQKP